MSKLKKLITKSETYRVGQHRPDIGRTQKIKNKIHPKTGAIYYEICGEKGMIVDYNPMQVFYLEEG